MRYAYIYFILLCVVNIEAIEESLDEEEKEEEHKSESKEDKDIHEAVINDSSRFSTPTHASDTSTEGGGKGEGKGEGPMASEDVIAMIQALIVQINNRVDVVSIPGKIIKVKQIVGELREEFAKEYAHVSSSGEPIDPTASATVKPSNEGKDGDEDEEELSSTYIPDGEVDPRLLLAKIQQALDLLESQFLTQFQQEAQGVHELFPSTSSSSSSPSTTPSSSSSSRSMNTSDEDPTLAVQLMKQRLAIKSYPPRRDGITLITHANPLPLEANIAQQLDELCPKLLSTPRLEDKALRCVFSIGFECAAIDVDLLVRMEGGRLGLQPSHMLTAMDTDDIFGHFMLSRKYQQ